jgi:transcription initiation factor IIE alpha subunit
MYIQRYYLSTNKLKQTTMTTREEIIRSIEAEIESKSIKSVFQCRERIQELCNNNNQAHNMFSIAVVFGVA